MVSRGTWWVSSITAALLGGVGVVGGAESADAPGDEVMRPTRYGLVASPEWLTPMMGLLVEESGWDHGADMTDAEKQQLAQSMSRRGMELARSHGREMQDFLQFAFEAAFEHNGPRNFDTATGQEFARRFLPVAGPLKDYFDGVMRDSRGFLGPESTEAIEDWLGRTRRGVEGLEKGMKRWAEGDVDERGNPFRVEELNEVVERSPEEQARIEQRRAQRRLRSRTQRELRDISPDAWPAFVRACDYYFGFDAEQKQKAEGLRLDFRTELQSLMSSEWRTKVYDNRARYYLLSESQGEPVGPYLFRLDQEFQGLVQPAVDVNQAFRDAVIALAATEQRQAALAKTADAAARHGLSVQDLEPVRALLSEAEMEESR